MVNHLKGIVDDTIVQLLDGDRIARLTCTLDLKLLVSHLVRHLYIGADAKQPLFDFIDEEITNEDSDNHDNIILREGDYTLAEINNVFRSQILWLEDKIKNCVWI